MPDKIIAASLELDTGKADQSVKSFKTELREANEELLQIQKNFGPTSDEAVAAAKRVGELKNQMQDAAELANSFNTDGSSGLKAFGSALQGLTGGFSALQGVMGLVGAQGEEVQKVLLKVQSAMAISQGVASIAEAAKGFQNLQAVIKSTTAYKVIDNAVTKAASVVMKLFGVSVDTTAVSFNVLKGAIAATGIGLLVVAIGFLVQKIIEWQGATDEQIKKQKELNDTLVDTYNKTSQNRLKVIEQEKQVAIERAKLAGESEEAIFKLSQTYDKRKQNELQTHYIEVGRIDGDAKVEAKKALDDFSHQQLITQLQYQVKVSEQQKAANEKYVAEQKALNEKLLEEEKNRRKQTQELAGSELVDFNEIKKEAQAKAAAEAQAKQEAEDEQIKKLEGLSGTSNITNQFRDIQAQIQAQQDLFQKLAEGRQTEFAKRQSELQANYEAELKIAGDNESLQYQVTEDYEKKKTALVNEEQRQRLNIASNLLGQASSLFAQHTAAYKVLAIAQTTIQTYQSATGAFAGMVSTIPGPVGIALGVAAAGFAVLSGLKNIQKIISTKVPGASGGGGSLPSLSASAPPPLSPTSKPVQTETTIDQDQVNKLGNATVRAYVVESDVSNTQEQVSRLNRAARLGG